MCKSKHGAVIKPPSACLRLGRGWGEVPEAAGPSCSSWQAVSGPGAGCGPVEGAGGCHRAASYWETYRAGRLLPHGTGGNLPQKMDTECCLLHA